jgi:hypothetical protein
VMVLVACKIKSSRLSSILGSVWSTVNKQYS